MWNLSFHSFPYTLLNIKVFFYRRTADVPFKKACQQLVIPGRMFQVKTTGVPEM